MRKPEQTTEPSIEEILASIRRIIADEGSSAAPSFDQGGPVAPQRSHPPHRDDYYEDDARIDEARARAPHFDDREPQYREAPRREPRYDDPHYDDPHQDERMRRGPQPRDFAPAPQDHNYRDPRSRDEYDGYHEPQPANGYRSRGPSDYNPEREFENGSRDDYQSREPVSADRLAAELSRSGHFNGSDFDRSHDRDDFERRGNVRHDFGDEGRAANSFDPYATEDDFDGKSARVLNNADDEILELTEDFMVEEVSVEGQVGGDVDDYDKYNSYDPSADTADNYASPLNFADLQPTMAPVSDYAAAGVATSEHADAFTAQDETAPIIGTMSPLTDDSFEDGKLDSVLSNVVAEMQRLSEGKGLSALLDDSASQDKTESTPEAMPAFAEEPQLQPQPEAELLPQPRAWQPKARQTSAPAQRPVWSARRLDSDGAPASSRTTTTGPLHVRERLSSGSGSPLEDELGSPFGEAMAPKTPSPEASAPQQPQSSAPTALARDANLKADVEEIMPELPEGDFPPEQSGQAPERSQTKAMIETLAAARAARKMESASSDETPELPSGADDEVVEPAPAAAPKAVTKPVTVASVVPISAPANANVAAVPAAPQQPRTEVAAAASASVPTAAVSSAAVEKIAAAALPVGIEDSVREMLKPLIAEWLQENLPRLAEEVLREELLDSGALAKRGGRG